MTLKITFQAPDRLAPYANNARTHSTKQITKIATSISKFGFNNPILVDKKNTIIAGHGRWQAAKQLKMAEIPTVCLDHLSEIEIRAYILADNKLAELAGWDPEILAIEFQHLTSLDLDFDIEITGFTTGEIDFLIDGPVSSVSDPADDFNGPDPDQEALTRPGDLIELGDHRLYCGDALAPESYTRLMGDDKARMAFTDPPYNVPIDGHVGGKGAIKHREFAMGVGEMDEAQFTAFLNTALCHIAGSSVSGAIAFVCMDWRHTVEVIQAGISAGGELKNTCVWVKDNGGMGSLYRSQHEFVFVFKFGRAAHINNVDLGKHGRYRTNVWEYAGVNTLRPGRMAELAMHPTVKPVALVMDAIKDCSKHGDMILDPFGGSGTTLIAAEKTGRKANLIEIDPLYCDVIVKRWEKLTGEKAVYEGGR